MTATIHWSKPICKEPDDYLGWGTIARKADGELLAVFSGRRESHWCPYGVNEIIRSTGRRRDVVGAGDHQQHASRRPGYRSARHPVGCRHHELVYGIRLAGF